MSLGEDLESLGLRRDAVERLLAYRDHLRYVNRRLNLISRAGGDGLIDSLILESATVSFEGGWMDPVLDLGSGGGLPGIPYASINIDDSTVLLERRQGRCDFLRRECRTLPLPNARVVEGDASELGSTAELRGSFATVFLKAVAAPDVALSLSRSFLAPGGRAALFRSADWAPGELDGWKYHGPHPAGTPHGSRPRPVVHTFSLV